MHRQARAIEVRDRSFLWQGHPLISPSDFAQRPRGPSRGTLRVDSRLVRYEWDEAKAKSNLRKHRVSFEEAVTVFGDWQSLTISDPDHSASEDRSLILGTSSRNRVLVVSHVKRGDNIRIISARRASTVERRTYGKEK
jgi:uncharacterized protein